MTPTATSTATAPISPTATPAVEEEDRKIPLLAKLLILLIVVIPFLGLVAAVALLWGWGFHWTELGLLAGMYALTGFGITVGFHRLFTHKSFETNPVMKFIFGVLGSMAVQGSLLRWVAVHRKHHQKSDQEGDPHSPHQHGKTVLSLLSGLWHAHLGWFFRSEPANLWRYVKDLDKSKLLRAVSVLFPLWVVLGLLIPTGLGWWLIGGWQGAVLGFVWGGLVRIFFVHHITWSINSVCHVWGRKPHKVDDESRNNFIFGVLGLGEGWHNNHHAFPTSARHGLHWWQIDFSYWLIRTLALFGLAKNIKTPTSSTLAEQT